MNYKEKASERIEKYREAIVGISKQIHAEPELGHQEYKSSKLLVDELKKHGYKVEYSVSGMETAFIARKGEGSPKIGILAEYDCLPGIGHACGHNLIAASALGAGIGLAELIEETGGEVIVFGTPAEEGVVQNAGGKVVMIDEIKKVDVAIMIHPSAIWGSYGTSNARESFLVEFYGKSSHAGGAPEKGINALDGILLTYTGINALRQHIPDKVRIHGIIKHGGDAPNTIPDYASAHLYVRAPTLPMLKETYAKVENIIKGAELQSGAKSRITQVANTYANTIPNKILSDVWRGNMVTIGVDDYPMEKELRQGGGSTDFGNVSQEIPALSAYINIGDVILHSPSGTEMTGSDHAYDVMMMGAKGLAYTALDLFTDVWLMKSVKQEYGEKISQQEKDQL